MNELTDMRVLIVDDNAANLYLVEQILRESGYGNVLSTEDPQGTSHLCLSWKPDLLVLDLHMPVRSGYEVMADIRDLLRDPENLPVLVLTADVTTRARHRALSMGARDFITKPIDQTELLLRVRNLLHTRLLQYQLMEHNAYLHETVRERTAELEQAALDSLKMLATVAEYHDPETHEHTQRVGETATLIAQALELPDLFVAQIRDAAPMHDIGKIGISRDLVLKPVKLTDLERTAMQRHVAIGAQILSAARSPVLRLAAEIALTHHERWDGTGYVAGLAGEDIPISGRITAVADVFDALTHDRPYKAAWPVEEAVAEITVQARHQFDPRVVKAFLSLDVERLIQGPVEGASEQPPVSENAEIAPGLLMAC